MADVCGALIDCLGVCGICIYSGLASWCLPQGCYGSRDDTDERMKKEQAKNSTNAEPVNSQPVSSLSMSQVPGDPKPTTMET